MNIETNTPIPNSERCNRYEMEVRTPALMPASLVQWTTEMPTLPGWYWLRHAILHGKAGAWHELHPVMVEVTQDRDGKLTLHMPELDHIWSLDDLIVAEWAGPLVPPA